MRTIQILLLLIGAAIIANGQTPNTKEWLKQKKTQRKYLVDQIIALQVFLGYLKKGYQVVDKGLTAISDSKGGTHGLDQQYYASLKQVSPVIRNSPKVNEILLFNDKITSEMNALVRQSRKDQSYTADEVKYIKQVSQELSKGCQTSMNELTMIATEGETQMKDAERLQRLNKVHEEMSDRFSFSMDFIKTARAIAAQRRRESEQIQQSKKLNEV